MHAHEIPWAFWMYSAAACRSSSFLLLRRTCLCSASGRSMHDWWSLWFCPTWLSPAVQLPMSWLHENHRYGSRKYLYWKRQRLFSVGYNKDPSFCKALLAAIENHINGQLISTQQPKVHAFTYSNAPFEYSSKNNFCLLYYFGTNQVRVHTSGTLPRWWDLFWKKTRQRTATITAWILN